MAEMFEILAEPNRRRILEQLRDGERSVNALVEVMEIGQPAVSRHLKVLRQAGLVSVRTDAQRRLYRVRPEPLAEVEAWIATFRPFWRDRLDALERFLDEDDVEER